MSNNIIGFLGIEKYDILIYLAKLLSADGKKVLIVDNNSNEALSSCVNIPSGLNPEKEVVTTKDKDFVKNQRVAKYEKRYDYILVDFGLSALHPDIDLCSSLLLVCDKQFHNQKIMQNIRKQLKQRSEGIYLVIRDVDPEGHYENLEEGLKFAGCFFLDFDIVDRKKMLMLQYGREIKLSNISYQYKELLEKIMVGILCIEKKDYEKVLRKLKRGA